MKLSEPQKAVLAVIWVPVIMLCMVTWTLYYDHRSMQIKKVKIERQKEKMERSLFIKDSLLTIKDSLETELLKKQLTR